MHSRTSLSIYSAGDENSTGVIVVPALRRGRYGRHRDEVGTAHKLVARTTYPAGWSYMYVELF